VTRLGSELSLLPKSNRIPWKRTERRRLLRTIGALRFRVNHAGWRAERPLRPPRLWIRKLGFESLPRSYEKAPPERACASRPDAAVPCLVAVLTNCKRQPSRTSAATNAAADSCMSGSASV
jgi:hypothetical protein